MMREARPCYHVTDVIGGSDVIGAKPVRNPNVPATLYSLADRLQRLAPSPRNPERFHEEKSEIAHALVELAREVRRG